MRISQAQVSKMLAYINRATRQEFTEADVIFWHNQLKDYVDNRDAFQAVQDLLAERKSYLTPLDVNNAVSKIRSSRRPSEYEIQDALAKAHAPAELDMPQAKQRLYRRLGDGVELNKAIQDTISELPQLAAKRAKPEITSKPSAPRAMPIVGQAIPQK